MMTAVAPGVDARTPSLHDAAMWISSSKRKETAMSRLVMVLNGPNLNLLGQRQPEIYGYSTLADVERDCRAVAREVNLELVFHQSNREY